MALDKQKILNELGNVVNQLQSADCGCMGKLFSNSGQANPNSNSTPNDFAGGMGSCCGHHGHHGHHGYNAPCAGEPHTGSRHCMGYCNPPKLYGDTYNYLNRNMMQPVVQEVYDDLKSINPNNTIMNNPMASQMGLSQANNPNQGNMPQNSMMEPSLVSDNHHIYGHNPHVHFGNALLHPGQPEIYHDPNNHQGITQMNQEISQPGHGMRQMGQESGQAEYGMGHMVQGMGQTRQSTGQMGQSAGQMGQGAGQVGQGMHQMMAGMGPQIVNMMSTSARNNFRPRQANPVINATDNKVHNSPEMGQPMPHTTGDRNMGQYNHGQLHPENYGTGTSNLSQPNMASGGAGHGNHSMFSNMQQHNPRQQPMGGNINANPQQTNNPNPYGQHSAGIAKFNEMFPGVMRSDLGFDPMAIAIQMNPANQQKSAMDTMQKMMMNNSGGMNRIIDSPQMQPVVNATNSVTASFAQPNQQLSGQAPDQQNIQQQVPGESPAEGTIQNNQPPQQVYTAVTGAPTMIQQQNSNKQNVQQPHVQIPNQQLTGSLPTVYEGSEEPVSNQQQSPAHVASPTTNAQHIYKEPIFPADTSRHLLQSHHFKAPKYNYNTLGQPIEMVSAVDYQTLTPVLPQAISGHGILARTTKDPMAFSNVKATVSKTAIVGNRPMGKTPSRSQLHHEYNQYKGSQSFTQQNIRPSGYTGSHSEGRINIPQGHAPPQHYIERVGGDTVINDQTRANEAKLEPDVDQIGDVPAAKKPLDNPGMTSMRNNKTRNGLQDQVYSSYPTSTKWSFHGTTPAPYSVGYRFRAK